MQSPDNENIIEIRKTSTCIKEKDKYCQENGFTNKKICAYVFLFPLTRYLTLNHTEYCNCFSNKGRNFKDYTAAGIGK